MQNFTQYIIVITIYTFTNASINAHEPQDMTKKTK